MSFPNRYVYHADGALVDGIPATVGGPSYSGQIAALGANGLFDASMIPTISGGVEVTSLNSLTGGITLVGGAGVGIAVSGQNIVVTASGACGILLETNGVANTVQNKLNLKSSTTITPIADSSGDVSFMLGGFPPALFVPMTQFSGSSVAVPWPSGAVAGDLIIIMIASAVNAGTTPTGWTLWGYNTPGTGWCEGFVLSKTLTSADITAGSVTVTFSTGTYGVYCVADAGPNSNGIREVDATSVSSFPTSITITTSSAVQPTDMAIYFGATGANNFTGGGEPPCSQGTFQSGFASGPILNQVGGSVYLNQQAPAGATSAVFNYAGGIGGPVSYAAVIIVESVVLTGSVTSVGLSMPSDFTVINSPITSAGVITVTGGVTKAGIQEQLYTAATDSGTANAYAITLAPPPTLGKNSTATFIVGNTNTGPSTLTVNGVSGNVYKQGTANLASGDWVQGQAVTVVNDGLSPPGGNWQWTGSTPGGGAAGFTLTTTGSGAASLTGSVLNVPTNIGLFAPLISSVPSSSNTGFTTSFNTSGTWATTNSVMGLTLSDSTGTVGENMEGLVGSYPGVAFTASGLFSLPVFASNFNLIGFVIMTSTTGKAMFFGWRYNTGVWQITVLAYNSPTSYNTDPYPWVSIVGNPATTWIRVQDDGTNIKFYASPDGVLWSLIYSVTKASSFLGSSGFVYFGVCIDRSNGPTGTALMGYFKTTP